MSDLAMNTARRVRQWLTVVVDHEKPERGSRPQVTVFIPRTLSEYPDSTDMYLRLTPEEADRLADMLHEHARIKNALVDLESA